MYTYIVRIEDKHIVEIHLDDLFKAYEIYDSRQDISGKKVRLIRIEDGKHEVLKENRLTR